MLKFIATPKTPPDQYPNRPLDNRERRALWAMHYFASHRPGEHPGAPTQPQKGI